MQQVKTVSFGNIPKTAGLTFSALWFGPKGEKKRKKRWGGELFLRKGNRI